MIEYYSDPKEGARVKKLNLRAKYEAREYKAPFHIVPLVNDAQGTYAVFDASGMRIADTWRQGVDAERIVEALNFFYTQYKGYP